MTKCAEVQCNTEFKLFTSEYACSICAKKFCENHVCSSASLKHFAGQHLPQIEKVIAEKKGAICASCFIKAGLSFEFFEKSLFKELCLYPDCNEKSKYSCKSCGGLYCKSHGSKAEMLKEWSKQHEKYPLAEGICSVCLSGEEAKQTANENIEHIDTSFLKLLAGKSDGVRPCIVVHGIMSNPENMSSLANALVAKDTFDVVWGFNSIAYIGRVNESKTFDITDIPLGVDSLIKTTLKVAGKRAIKMIDLPAYIVEGAAQELFQAIKSSNMSHVTLIGHSLGGLVCRCAVETYAIEDKVKNVITLASPQRLWLGRYGGDLNLWKQHPKKDIRYLAILGKGDIVAKDWWSDYTKDDAMFSNVLKVLVDGGHSSIHEKPYGTYVPDIQDEINNASEQFYVVVENAKPYLKYQPLHGTRKEEPVDIPHGQWLDFVPSK
jgi:pimeloyl-ACP methyl ester carboxylesterase